MYRLDLHTHSQASPDGGLRLVDYQFQLEHGGLDYIAITDHDAVAFAQAAQASLGNRIIVGEEISTRDGELIGLFLREIIPSGLEATRTAGLIHEQGALVYVPHPLETVRHGLSLAALDAMADQIDIIEVFNGRAWIQNKSSSAKRWAAQHHKAGAASSDAHGRLGWGNTHSVIDVDVPPTARTLPAYLQTAQLIEQGVGFGGLLYPKLNRLRKLRSR
jgi:predicted metal-dependent phosphoesterase TrpH